MTTKRGFKKILQRIEYLESKSNSKYMDENSSSLSDDDIISNSNDDLYEFSKIKSKTKVHRNHKNSYKCKSDDFELSDSDEEFSYQLCQKNNHISLSSDYFSSDSSFSIDSQKSFKTKRKHQIKKPFHYSYKKYCKDFSLDSATSDFDSIFLDYCSAYSNSSDSFHDD